MSETVKLLPDYAEAMKVGNRPLQKVGIDDVKMFRLDFNDERVLTSQGVYVSLSNQNGIHMSRLVEAIFEHENKAIDIDDSLILDIANSHGVNNSYWECVWPSQHLLDNEQPLFIGCGLEAVYMGNEDEIRWYLTMKIPYASVCPCSAEMTKVYGGHPHIQRAEAKVTGLLSGEESLNSMLTTVTTKIVDAVGLVPIPVMKRNDELRWCQTAGVVNLFVEDAARSVSEAVEPWFEDWVVVCKHFESIHQHNVVAVCRKGDVLV